MGDTDVLALIVTGCLVLVAAYSLGTLPDQQADELRSKGGRMAMLIGMTLVIGVVALFHVDLVPVATTLGLVSFATLQWRLGTIQDANVPVATTTDHPQGGRILYFPGVRSTAPLGSHQAGGTPSPN